MSFPIDDFGMNIRAEVKAFTPMPTARKQQAARKHTTAGFMSRSEFMAAAQRTRR